MLGLPGSASLPDLPDSASLPGYAGLPDLPDSASLPGYAGLAGSAGTTENCTHSVKTAYKN